MVTIWPASEKGAKNDIEARADQMIAAMEELGL